MAAGLPSGAIRHAAGRLSEAGFPDARREARQLAEACRGDPDTFACWVERRLEGEPLEWLTGYVTFLGQRVRVHRNVYVPRPQTEQLAARAVHLLPERGLAADVATGCGAVAMALSRGRPGSRVVASDIDPSACACAAANGVEVYEGYLERPLPAEMVGCFDVVTAVVPYVPTEEMGFLPRDVLRHEPNLALDGGPGGLSLLAALVEAGPALVRPGGWMVLEVGGEQAGRLRPLLPPALALVETMRDGDGDLRGVVLRRIPDAQAPRAVRPIVSR